MGICQCCGADGKTLIVEHNHKTDMVRGITCQRCNSLIAAFEVGTMRHRHKFIEDWVYNDGFIVE